MSGSSALVGALMTLADPTGRLVQLEVFLSKSATVSANWAGTTQVSSEAALHHVLGPWPISNEGRTRWRVHGPGFHTEGEVADLSERPLRVALYGGRGGFGQRPHIELTQQIARWRPHLVVFLGRLEDDKTAAEAFVGAVQSVARKALLVMPFASFDERPSEFRSLKLGRAHFWVIEPKIGPGPAVSGLRASKFFSSAEALGLALASQDRSVQSEATEKLHPAAVFSGRPHYYERRSRGATLLLVSGGGGSPLERPGFRWRPTARASVHHWLQFELRSGRARLEARTLNGLLLDETELPAPAAPEARSGWAAWAAIAFVLGTAPRRCISPFGSKPAYLKSSLPA